MLTRTWFRSAILLLLVGSLLATPAQSRGIQGQHRAYLPLLQRGATLTGGLDFPATLATHFGGAGADSARAVDVDGAGMVLWGGRLSDYPAGVPVAEVLGGGPGALLVVGPDGQPRQGIRIGAALVAESEVYDLEIGLQHRAVVCGNWGLAVINYMQAQVLWSVPDAVQRCSIGADGTVAAARRPHVTVYAANGTQLGTWDTNTGTGDGEAFDVAVASAQQLVVATGYKQKSSNLQVAWMHGRSYAGAQVWTAYDFSASAVQAAGLGADTRGRRVAIGEDGMLYFAGRADGSTAIFGRNPHNIAAQATIVKTDPYNDPYNNSATIMWYGRYDPATGALDRGQYTLARLLSNNKGNTVVPLSIDADGYGNVYVAGQADCCIGQRNDRRVAGTLVGPYASGEGFLLVVSADLRTRYVWTPFAGPAVSANGSPVQAVAVRSHLMATTATLNNGRMISTPNAWHADPISVPDAYLVLWQQ